jgi:hypothetical protein
VGSDSTSGTEALDAPTAVRSSREGSKPVDSVSALEVDDGGTIVPKKGRVRAGLRPDQLPLILAVDEAAPGDVPQLAMGTLVGSGGMGVVRTATQLPLGRRVAIKQPRGADPADAALALFGEALTTGYLEHPNIVPIHALGRDKSGSPMLVMKYIEGALWQRELQEPNRLTRLNRHLGILMQVCNAVHFAHDRGILHRDLKPSNVMMGKFGEVYVLDWGLAVSLREEHADRLPLARDVTEIEGTPGYMPPEMARGQGKSFDARTDVYLLGGLLHFILAGRPPHDAEHPGAQVMQALGTDPGTFAASVPRELAIICGRALASKMEERFASAAELRDAIADYLQHQSSLTLAASAAARVEVLADRVAAADGDPMLIQALASEARFGFREALRHWPENPEAREGLKRVVELVTTYETERNRRLAELEALRHGLDTAVDEGKRGLLVGLMGLLVVGGVLVLVVARVTGIHQAGYPDGLVLSTITLCGAVALWWRRLRGSNEFNLRLWKAFVQVVACGGAQLALSWWAGIDFTTGMALLMALYSTGTFMIAASQGNETLRPAGFVFGVTAALLVAFPAYRPTWLALGFATAFVALLTTHALRARAQQQLKPRNER